MVALPETLVVDSLGDGFRLIPNYGDLPADAPTTFRRTAWMKGFRPVPVRTREKRPAESDWRKVALDCLPPCLKVGAHARSDALSTGILCDGLRVIDIDVDDAEIGGQIEALARDLLGDALVRFRANSPRVALVYRAADGAPPKRTLQGDHGQVEVLGSGQQFVAHGVHPSGAEYQWRAGSPATVRREDIPAVTEEDVKHFLADAARLLGAAPVSPPPAEVPRAAAPQAAPPSLPAIVTTPADHEHPRVRGWAQAAFKDEIEGVATCPPGGRNEQLNKAAFAIGQFVPQHFTEAQAIGALEQAADACGLWKDDGALQCRKTISSGLNSGMREPRPIPPDILEDIEADRMGAEIRRTLVFNEDGSRTDMETGEVFEPEATWPALVPITSSLPSVLPLTRDMLPPAIGDYVLDVAERQQSPADFAAVAALCGLASIVGNRVRVKPKCFDDWMVVPTLWGAIIGKPSAMKSPAMKAALAPVYTLESEALKEWEEQCAASRLDLSMASIDAKNARSAAEKAAKAGNREEAMRLIAELSQNAARIAQGDPPCPRLVVNSATVEKLGELLKENPSGLLLVRDELAGLLARMGREEYAEERSFYLTAFNGDDSFIYDRIGRGTVRIANCTLSFIGGIQPARIAPLVRGALTGESDDGLIQRLQLAVWPDDQREWEWVDRTPDGPARERYLDLFRRVRHGAAEYQDEPAIFSLDAEALGLFRDYSEAIHREARSGNLSPTLESHILKQPKTIVSLALIFQLAIDGRQHLIEAEAMRMAIRWARYLRSHANRLYAAGGVVAEDGARLILERRAQLRAPFTVRAVHQKDWAGLTDADTVAAAIDVLVAAGHCRPMPAKAGESGGRPTTKYEWRPDLKA